MTGETSAKQRRGGRIRAAVFTAALLAAAVPAAASAQAPSESATLRLFQAVRAGDMTALQDSLTSGANTGARNTAGRTAAEVAKELGRFGMAQWLRMQPPPPAGAANQVIKEIITAAPETAAEAVSQSASQSAPAAAAGATQSRPAPQVVIDLGAEADPFGAAALGIAPVGSPTPLNAAALPPEPAVTPAPPEPAGPAAAPQASAQTAELTAARSGRAAAADSAAADSAAAQEPGGEDPNERTLLDRIADFFEPEKPAAESASASAGQAQQAGSGAAAQTAQPAQADQDTESFFDNLRQSLGFGENDEESSTSGAAGTAQAGEAPEARSWETSNAQTARASGAAAEEETPPEPTASALLSLDSLRVGGALNLGRQLPALDEAALRASCVSRRQGAVVVCIELLDWPGTLAPAVQTVSRVIQGSGAIVRYDNGAATRFHALFPAEVYETVKAHYAAKYGLPNEVHRWRIALLEGVQNNRAALWSNVNPADQSRSWLEIRRFDDTRGGFPDQENGVLMLYGDSGGPLFPQVSIFDLAWLRPINAAGSPAPAQPLLQPVQ